MTDEEKGMLERLKKRIYEKYVSNLFLVELIKLSGDHLNLMTVPDYAKTNNISYVGAVKDTKLRTNIELFNVKFIIENN